MLSEPVLLSLPGRLPSKSDWRTWAVRDVGCAEVNLVHLDFMLGLPGRRSPDLQLLTGEP
ncbi:hypothetical protein AB0K14_25575 [Actinosynnema sp. NPDC050801]|uniref:hypothetical protein n=1 Tax=unclassified Actinosynnema TaxID=2637065 RepID=UPI0033EA803D